MTTVPLCDGVKTGPHSPTTYLMLNWQFKTLLIKSHLRGTGLDMSFKMWYLWARPENCTLLIAVGTQSTEFLYGLQWARGYAFLLPPREMQIISNDSYSNPTQSSSFAGLTFTWLLIDSTTDEVPKYWPVMLFGWLSLWLHSIPHPPSRGSEISTLIQIQVLYLRGDSGAFINMRLIYMEAWFRVKQASKNAEATEPKHTRNVKVNKRVKNTNLLKKIV